MLVEIQLLHRGDKCAALIGFTRLRWQIRWKGIVQNEFDCKDEVELARAEPVLTTVRGDHIPIQ